MTYSHVIFALLILSTFGYVNFCRMKWRMTFTMGVFFVVSCQTMLMMASGFCHCMKQFAWLMFAGGIGVGTWLVIKSLKRHPLRNRGDLARFFGKEYLFCSGIFYLAFLYFYFGKRPYWGVDYAVVWYPHFLNLIFNNKWVDGDFHCYASAYCMIGNAYSVYLAHLLRDTGTHVYSFGTLLLTICGIMPLFSKIEWKKITLEGVLLCLVCIASVTFYMDYMWVVLLLCCLIAGKLFFECKNSLFGLFVNHLQIVFISCIGIYLLFASFGGVYDYPFDGALGGYSIGIFATFMLDFSHGYRRFRSLWVLIPMLFVLSLIKPTGVIPALLLALLICGYSTAKWFKSKFPCMRKKYMSLGLVFAVALTPLVAYYAWHFYCVALNWEWHEDFSGKARFLTHLKSGIPEDDLQKWKEKFDGSIAYIARKNEMEKSGIMVQTEKMIGNFLIEHGWNIDKSFSEKYDGAIPWDKIHHFPAAVLLLLLDALCIAGIKKRRVSLLYHGASAFAIYLIVCVNQYYFAPMYTNLPAIMRYLWYGVAVMFAFTVCAITLLSHQKRYFICLISMLLFVFIFKPMLFKRHAPQIAERDKDSGVGEIVDIINYFSYGGKRQLGRFDITKYLHPMSCAFHQSSYPVAFLMNKGNMILDRITSKTMLSDSGCILLSYEVPSDLKTDYMDEYSDVTTPGFYYGIKNADGKFHFEPLYLEKKALDLVESAYSDRDWKSLLEQRPIKISTKDKDVSKSKEDSKSSWQVGEKYLKLDVKEKGFVFRPTMERNFFFDEDVVSFSCRFTGEIPQEKSFSLYMHIYDSKKIWKMGVNVPMTCKRTGKNQYELSGICEMKYVDKTPYWNHYSWEMRCPVGAKGKLDDIELTQKVSACLDLDGMAFDYENSHDGLKKPPIEHANTVLTNDDLRGTTYHEVKDGNSVFTAGRTLLFSKTFYRVEDNHPYEYSVTIKNAGEVPTQIYTGFAAYNQNKEEIQQQNCSYGKQLLPAKVVSGVAGESTLTVEGVVSVEKDLRIATDAKMDNSDVPNMNTIPNKIVSARTDANGNTVITLDSPLKTTIPVSSYVRICDKTGGYLYCRLKLLNPGEEFTFTGNIAYNDSCFEYNSKFLPHGTRFVRPAVLSYSRGSQEANSIQIKDFKFKY